jgi:uncharacterized protein
MIIDVHTHLNNYDESIDKPVEQCRDELLQTMDKNRIDYALVLSSYKVNKHRPSTAQVIRATENNANLGVVAGISYLNYKEKDLRELSDFLKDGLVKGLKLYPGYEPFYPYDPRCRVIYDLALEFDVPVMIHTGDTYAENAKLRFAHPLNVDDVAVDNPGLKLVICHLGNPWIRDCMEVVYKNTHVYADISGLVLGGFTSKYEKFMHRQLKEMMMFAGDPNYLLYGTDWPISSMESYTGFMKSLKLSKKLKELILWKNAAELFRIPVLQTAET